MNRTGIVLLSVLALVGLGLVGGDTDAWGHGAIAGGGDRVHTCVRGGAPRTVRVVTAAQNCTGSETGIDIPHNGTFIGVDIGTAVTTSIGGAAAVSAGGSTGPITVACTPDPSPPNPPIHRAVGATVSQASDLVVAESRLASPTSWEVRLVTVTGVAANATKTATVAPLCMRLFQQQ